MKLIEKSIKGMKRAAIWYLDKTSEVYQMTNGNRFLI